MNFSFDQIFHSYLPKSYPDPHLRQLYFQKYLLIQKKDTLQRLYRKKRLILQSNGIEKSPQLMNNISFLGFTDLYHIANERVVFISINSNQTNL
ncbi:MAG: hypothetical protein H6Q14_1841 [Bacteroidetes bacterium]|jgi:hypothetical protein|nr:hypothetical protein [Bacteroidota bacterium]